MLRWTVILAALVLVGCGGREREPSDPEPGDFDAGLTAADGGDVAPDVYPADAECQPGERRCQESWQAAPCGPDGKWTPLGTPAEREPYRCTSEEACARGRCVPRPQGAFCIPGAHYCVLASGATAVCNPDGLGWSEVDCAGGTCGPEGCSLYPTPEGAVCVPGQRRCGPDLDGSGTIETCELDGSGWRKTRGCEMGNICRDALCQ